MRDSRWAAVPERERGWTAPKTREHDAPEEAGTPAGAVSPRLVGEEPARPEFRRERSDRRLVHNFIM